MLYWSQLSNEQKSVDMRADREAYGSQRNNVLAKSQVILHCTWYLFAAHGSKGELQ